MSYEGEFVVLIFFFVYSARFMCTHTIAHIIISMDTHTHTNMHT
jgi:hypothetical protein